MSLDKILSTSIADNAITANAIADGAMFGEVAPSGTTVNFNEIFDNTNWFLLPAANLTGSGNEYFYVTGSYFAA